MAAPGTLGDFFAKGNKKKIKGSNLNVAKPEAKVEAKKGKKDAEEEGWEEQEVVAATMKVEVAGKLTREEDKKDEEETSAPAWGTLKKGSSEGINERKFPTLAKSIMQSSNVNIDDGSNAKINIETSKNAFQALGGGADSDDDGPKRPTEIKPAMVQKKKGEFEKVALKREVDKYTAQKKAAKKKEKKENESDESEEEEEVEEAAEEVEEAAAPAKKEEKKKKVIRKVEEQAVEEKEEAEVQEDLKIVPDLAAATAKYAGRRKLPVKELSREELEEDKENRPQPAAGKKKKNKGNVDDEEQYTKKLLVCPF